MGEIMIDVDKLKGLDGVDYVASVPAGETIVDMITLDGNLFIATDKHIYQLIDVKRLERVK